MYLLSFYLTSFIESFSHSVIHSLTKHLWSTFKSGTMFGFEDIIIKKQLHFAEVAIAMKYEIMKKAKHNDKIKPIILYRKT